MIMKYSEKIDWETCPHQIRRSLKLYVDYHNPTGGFLNSVLENDLFNAVVRADPINTADLGKIVRFIRNELEPRECFGSKENVEAWLSPQSLRRTSRVDGRLI